MKLDLHDYFIDSLNAKEFEIRKQMRLLKNEIKHIYSAKAMVRQRSESELRSLVEESPELLEEYDALKKQIEDIQYADIKRMIKQGKLREVFYDKEGNELRPSGESESDRDS